MIALKCGRRRPGQAACMQPAAVSGAMVAARLGRPALKLITIDPTGALFRPAMEGTPRMLLPHASWHCTGWLTQPLICMPSQSAARTSRWSPSTSSASAAHRYPPSTTSRRPSTTRTASRCSNRRCLASESSELLPFLEHFPALLCALLGAFLAQLFMHMSYEPVLGDRFF